MPIERLFAWFVAVDLGQLKAELKEPSGCRDRAESIAWRFGMTTLYLVQQGTTLRKDHGRFLIQSKSPADSAEALEVPIREVEQILVFGNVQITTAALSSCLEAQVPILFLSQTGQYKGHVWSAEQGSFAAELAQFSRFPDPALQLEMARAIVLGKLSNSRQLLLRLNRKRNLELVAAAIAGIERDLRSAVHPETVDALRGYEGVAAARYFPAFGQLLLDPAWNFAQRTRRPPTDPINAMLSFGYTLLFNNVLSLLLAEGLNPYLGNLHRSDRKEPHLAFDLMEEFRSPIVDTLVLSVANRQMIKPADFTAPASNGGVYLTDLARRCFLAQFEQRISTETAHPDAADPVSYRRAIQLQIRRYKNSVLRSLPYQPFMRAV
jgi:CRISP-associated protein Cas1